MSPSTDTGRNNGFLRQFVAAGWRREHAIPKTHHTRLHGHENLKVIFQHFFFSVPCAQPKQVTHSLQCRSLAVIWKCGSAGAWPRPALPKSRSVPEG